MYALLRLLVQTCPMVKKHGPCDTFFRNHAPNCVPGMFAKRAPIYFPSRKYKLSSRCFLECCYTIVFMSDISCPSKWCLEDDRNLHKMFLAMNLIIIFINSFICINTFSVGILFKFRYPFSRYPFSPLNIFY